MPGRIPITEAPPPPRDSRSRVDVDDSGGVLVSTGDFLGTDHPTIRNPSEDESVPLMRVLNEVAAEGMPLVLPMHPRTAARLREHLPAWPRWKAAGRSCATSTTARR